MPLMTGSNVTKLVGERCAWVPDLEPKDFPFTYCGAPSAYVLTSKLNNLLFYACEKHMATERLRNPWSIKQIQTYSSAGACDS